MRSAKNGYTQVRTWQKSPNLPVRTYFLLLYLLVLCILFPVFSYNFLNKTNSFRDTQLQQAVHARTQALEEKAGYLTRSISLSGTQSISEFNFSFLHNVIQETVFNDPDLLGCRIFNKKKDISSFEDLGIGGGKMLEIIQSGLKEGAELLNFPERIEQQSFVPVIKIPQEQKNELLPPILHFVAPIYVGGELWGTVNTLFSLKNLHEDIDKIEDDWLSQIQRYKHSLYGWACIVIILGICFAYLFTRPLLKALDRLRDGVDQVSQGDLYRHIHIGGLQIDEVVSLSHSFNSMTDNLRITRQKLDEYSHSLEEKVNERTRELQETQAELMSRAHEAGMSEMAVGVLHNIGNAITPAKVAAMLLEKQLASSPLRSNLTLPLASAAKVVLASQSLSENERKQLSTVLSLLPASLKEEYNQFLDAIQGIITKHNYMEETIRLQMRYTKLSGTFELVDPNKVVRDGLKMLADIIQNSKITVETSLQDVSKVLIEENKLLQIMVNLIKNSCEAMEGNNNRPRILTISSEQKEKGGPVTLALKDTGCGFDPTMREHLFSFGYSTKKRYSGYGLHSSANYLIANNGSIEAMSEGKEKGAEFIIQLQPVESVTNEGENDHN